MAEVQLCGNGIVVRVVDGPSGHRLTIYASGSDEPDADFLTDPSLLRGVLGGCSYQVASDEGSLLISATADEVTLRFECSSVPPCRGRVTREEYERSLHELGSGDV